MNKEIIKKIESNHKLINFCNKIISYNIILENETTRNMFFASLISADCLIDINSCNETIETANFILNNINLFELEDSIKQDTIKYCNNAINIANRDKKTFLNVN